jgi:triacylglycerol lipase
MSQEQQPCPSHTRSLLAWSTSAINALVGDSLRDERNGLAVEMAFYARNRPLPLSREALLRAHPHPTGKLVVLVHGLGCNEGIWAFHDPAFGRHATSYGARLQSDLGYTPFFVRYNTGLSVEENGEHLSALLRALLDGYPLPVEELVLIGHSMGGLVIGGAAQAASRDRAAWLDRVRRVIYVGTPHDGAPLARLGHTAATVLQMVPNPITRLIGTIFDRRSAGLKDLRNPDRLRAEGVAAPEATVRPCWPAHTRHLLIVGMVSGEPAHPLTVLLGDGLVPLPGRAGRSRQASNGDADRLEEIRLVPRTHHLQLSRDAAVYEQIREWCGTP